MYKQGLSFLLLIIIGIVMITPYEAQASSYSTIFSDVSPKNSHYDSIHTMSQKGYIKGYEDGTFKPNDPITRKHAAAIISRAFPYLITKSEPREFNDLSPSDKYYDDLMRIYTSDLFLVLKKEENIRPNDLLTRAEMAYLIDKAYGFSAAAGRDAYKQNEYPFTDSTSSWYTTSIIALVKNNIASGYPDQTFRVDEPITRAHFATFMYKAEQNMDPLYRKILEMDIFRYAPRTAPVPEGYTDAESLLATQNKKFIQYSAKFNFFGKGGTGLYSPYLLHKVKTDAVRFGITPEEYLEILKYVTKTGEVYAPPADNEVQFAVFYDFYEGFLYTGLSRDSPTLKILYPELYS